MRKRPRRGHRRSIPERLVAAHGRRLRALPGVLGIGVGAPYSESQRRIVRRGRAGTAVRWTGLALKVFVARKHEPPRPEDRIPRHVTLAIGSGPNARRQRFRVDVVTVGAARRTPRTVQLQAGDATVWPRSGTAAPGTRFLFGAPSPGRPAPEGLDAGFRWEIGTVGCLADAGSRRYIVTAGHVVADVYEDNAVFPTQQGTVFQVGFSREQVHRCSNDGLTRIIPASPRTGNGITMDAVGVPLPAAVPAPDSPRWVVADSADLFSFVGRQAFVLVERDGVPAKVRGEIEAVRLVHEETLASDSGSHTVRVPQVVILRFLGTNTTEPGDSGAPMLMLKDGTLCLLGFHFFEGGRIEAQADDRTFSEATAAYLVLDRLGATLPA